MRNLCLKRESESIFEIGNSHDCDRILYAAGHAGTGVQWSMELCCALPQNWAMRVVHLPGRERRLKEPAVDELAKFAISVAEEINQSHPRNGSAAAFWGQSMGGIIAFEICRHLESIEDRIIDVLGILGAPAPITTPWLEDPHCTDEELIAAILQTGATSPAIFHDEGLKRMLLNVLRKDMLLYHKYNWSRNATIDASIIAIRGRDDPLTALENVRAWELCSTNERFAFLDIAGGHLPLVAAFNHFIAMIKN